MSRKIVITVKAQDLNEVLNSLEISEEYLNDSLFTLEVDIKDSKKNFKYLSTSDKIVDWDLVDDSNDEKANKSIEKLIPREEVFNEVRKGIKEQQENKTVEEKKVKDSTFKSDCQCGSQVGNACKFERESDKPTDIDRIVLLFTGLQRYPVCNYESICRFINAVWNVKTTSPAFLFSEKVFEQRVLADYISLSNKEYLDTFINIISNFYVGSMNITEVFKDVLNRLKQKWNIIDKCSSGEELIIKLFNEVGYAVRFFG